MNTTYTRGTFVTIAAVGARRGLIALAIVVGLLLTLSASAAHAATPEVTASENPVVIPYSQDTKDIKLTWSLEARQLLATLTVTGSGTPAPMLDQTVSSTPGEDRMLTVTYGKTYTAQLKDVTDDSDDLSDCDCWFWFNAGDETPKPYGSSADPKSIATGTTYSVRSRSATGPPRGVE